VYEEKLKILQIIIAFLPSTFGGIKNHLYYQAREMVRKGHTVVICTSNAYSRRRNHARSGLHDVEGISVRYFKRLLPYSLFFVPSLPFYLRKNIRKYDLVHLQDFRTFPNVFAYYYAKKHNVPYVLSAGGSVPRGRSLKTIKKWIFDKLVGNNILRNAAKLIALSEVEVEQYQKAGIQRERITIVPNAVDPEEIPNSLKPGYFKEKYKIKEKFLISFVGRIHEIKGLDFLAKSFAVLSKQEPSSRLVIAGGDHGYMSTLQGILKRLRLHDRVLFTGYISGMDKWSLYLDSDVFVLPSRKEAFGNVVPEAAFCETPIVVSDGCAVSRCVQENGFGIVAKFGDVEELSSVLLRVLRDNTLKKELARNAKAFTLKNWTWERSTDILLDAYCGVTGA
jgi:glycosyltransferase involved in cell wall biosynthesis